MKVITRGYGVRMTTEERQVARAQAADMTRTRGTAQKPQPPQNLVTQSGPRGFLVSWGLPSGFNLDIQRWRVYKDNENTLYAEINDRGTRQCFVETTAGATPPTVNIFVSSVNALGVESQQVQAQGKAVAEAGAPSMPVAASSLTGSDLSTDYLNRRSGCVRKGTPVKVPAGTTLTYMPCEDWVQIPAPDGELLEMHPDTLVGVWVKAAHLQAGMMLQAEDGRKYLCATPVQTKFPDMKECRVCPGGEYFARGIRLHNLKDTTLL